MLRFLSTLALGSALLLEGCPESAATLPRTPPASNPAATASLAPAAASSAPPAAPPQTQARFFPVLGADGRPSATPLLLYPIFGATLFLQEAPSTWRIHKLRGSAIELDAMPVRGLPHLTAWDGLVGRYPDALWMRAGNATGGLDWYRWQEATDSWILDKSVGQGRRTSADIVFWPGRRLLLVRTDPPSILGSPEATSLMFLPEPRGAKTPRLPRVGPLAVAGSSKGELFAAFDDPAEMLVVRSVDSSVARVALPWEPGCSTTMLVLRLSGDGFAVCSGNGRSQLAAVDRARAELVPAPGEAGIEAIAPGRGDSWWLLDGKHTLWTSGRELAWTAVALPRGVEPASLAASLEDGRIWIRLGPEKTPSLLLSDSELRMEPNDER